ncbi:MAG: tRNA lysidine(34) synthetase TilS [Muribaculaceae bacterium]|nr:tRNA lysidine(34) synthetase TilS [Muribaculaceae bacterium]MDE6131396.1 tRNA lysidine(34) synthetase TilS [Muribaculaceae bacterium]
MNTLDDTSLVSAMRGFIDRHGLLSPGRPVIVALSGGADSVALLAALTDAGYECLAAHCNFHLRGEESMRDAAHCADICRRLGVDLTLRDFDVPERMARTGESVEMACRSLRYEWFESMLDRERAQAIAVGHHREDSVETFMLNMLRGTGPRGLCGIRPRNGYVVRPLLSCNRRMIEDYLRTRGLEFVTDSTNAENDFKRNRLRNIVLPALEEQFPGAGDAVCRTAGQVSECMALYSDLVKERAARYRRGSDILVADMVAAEPHARMLLYEMLHESEGFNMSAVSDIIAAAGRSGRTFISADGHIRELHGGVLRTAGGSHSVDEEFPVDLRRDILSPVYMTVTRHHVSEFRPERNPSAIYLDASVLDDDSRPLTLRHWRRGDRLDPFGMKGSRLVSDIFSDAGLDPGRKRSVWLLCQGDRILWVCGLRASRHFSVGPDTKEYIRVELRAGI